MKDRLFWPFLLLAIAFIMTGGSNLLRNNTQDTRLDAVESTSKEQGDSARSIRAVADMNNVTCAYMMHYLGLGPDTILAIGGRRGQIWRDFIDAQTPIVGFLSLQIDSLVRVNELQSMAIRQLQDENGILRGER